jgi:hypothetical protein
MAGTKRRASFRELLKKFNILSPASEFLLSLLSFVMDNIETFKQTQIFTIKVQDTDITFMCQTLISVNIRNEFTILELSYSIIFPPLSKV